MWLPDICFFCASLGVLGAFYVFAGIVATRAALTSYFFEWAIAQIAAKRPSRAETLRTVWLLGAAFLVLAGGLCLVLQLEIAAWIFVASALGQAFYIAILAPRFFDRDDPPEPKGREQTVTAFMLYSVVTAGIAWAAKAGYLTSPPQTPWSSIIIVAVALLAHLMYVATRLLKLNERPAETGSDDGPDNLSGE